MNVRIRAFAMGLALACAMIDGARAATPATPPEVLFTITGGGNTYTFQLNPSSALGVPDTFALFPSVPITVTGDDLPIIVDLYFLSTEQGETGGFFAENLAGNFLFRFSGKQFYSGPESSPMFASGINSLPLLNEIDGKTDIVTVKLLEPPIIIPKAPDPPSLAIPELSTWAMLLIGFAGLAFAGYRRALRTA